MPEVWTSYRVQFVEEGMWGYGGGGRGLGELAKKGIWCHCAASGVYKRLSRAASALWRLVQQQCG